MKELNIQVPSRLLTIRMYDPVPIKVMATKGHILNGLWPGVGLGPDSPDAKRRVVFLKGADGN